MLNEALSCKTPGCKGNLVPPHVSSQGLGGSLSITFCCDGCSINPVVFDTCMKNYQLGGCTNTVSMSVKVAFIVAGSTHAVYYYKTLKHALGIDAVCMDVFMDTIYYMYPTVKSILDDICEAAKQDMKDKKYDELGSWKRAVTVADGTWQRRGWQSKNATFTIRNYLNGALLYYHHLCQKGSDKVIEEELYKGTSKSAEGYAARVTFQRPKRRGMQVAVHWQDADSSSAKAVSEVFPDAEIMICGGHAGRANRRSLELRQKIKKVPKKMLQKYRDTFPAMGKLRCKCDGGNHSPTCECLNPSFISKVHTNFTLILMEAQSQEEFVRRVKALAYHA